MSQLSKKCVIVCTFVQVLKKYHIFGSPSQKLCNRKISKKFRGKNCKILSSLWIRFKLKNLCGMFHVIYKSLLFNEMPLRHTYSRLSGGQRISVLTTINVLKEEKDEAGNNADGKMTKSLPGRCNLTSVIGHPTAAQLTYKDCTRMSKK